MTIIDELLTKLETDTLKAVRRDLRKGFEASTEGFPRTTLADAKRMFSDDLCQLLGSVSDTIERRQADA